MIALRDRHDEGRAAGEGRAASNVAASDLCLDMGCVCCSVPRTRSLLVAVGADPTESVVPRAWIAQRRQGAAGLIGLAESNGLLATVGEAL